jgi:sec-independent protein translocase protein TatB
MFDLSWTELLVIAVVAIIVVGPKDLPRALRAIGRWTGKAKRMARDFQNQFNEALREAELDTVKKDMESVAKIDPMADMRKEAREIEAGLKPKPVRKAAGKKAAGKKAADPEMSELAADKGTTEPTPNPPKEAPPPDAVADAKP